LGSCEADGENAKALPFDCWERDDKPAAFLKHITYLFCKTRHDIKQNIVE